MKRLSSCILGVALTVSLAEGIAHAQNNPDYAKTNYFERDLYPMKLTAIDYDNGEVSGMQKRVWGNWTVSFKELYAYAKWNPVKGSNEPGVLIEGLTCENPTLGALDCNMGLFALKAGKWCAISFVDDKEPFIRVKCPKDLFIFPNR